MLRTPFGVRFAKSNYRVAENHKIRVATDFLDQVGGPGIAVVEMRSCCRCKMSAGGKAHDTDLVRLNIPFGYPGADRADCSLCVFKRCWMHVTVAVVTIF